MSRFMVREGALLSLSFRGDSDQRSFVKAAFPSTEAPIAFDIDANNILSLIKSLPVLTPSFAFVSSFDIDQNQILLLPQTCEAFSLITICSLR